MQKVNTFAVELPKIAFQKGQYHLSPNHIPKERVVKSITGLCQKINTIISQVPPQPDCSPRTTG